MHQHRLERSALGRWCSIVRDHKVVAHGTGHLGSSFRLQHARPLHGKYTLFVEIPGVTTSSQKIRIS